MTALEKKIIKIAKQHPDYDEVRALQELKSLSDMDLIEELWKMRDKSGNKNHLNLALAYYMGITSCKPSGEFKLEKRRTYGRSGFPDIDMDFDYVRRGEIVHYLKEKYGYEYVSNIGTLQTFKTKAAVRRAVKVLDPTNSIRFDANGIRIKEEKGSSNANFELENEILKTLPSLMKRNDGSIVESVKDAYECFSKFRKYMDSYPEIYRIAQVIEGTVSGYGQHAAGVVVSPVPLSRIAPLHVTASHSDTESPEKVVATQFPMAAVENLGLIKFDVLGLSTLTSIEWAREYIEEGHGIKIDWDKVPLDDDRTLSLLGSGNTDGCFQLENPGMKECLQQIGVDSFDDLVVAVAMYRPGPKDYIPYFAARKQGKVSVTYAHPLLEKITKKTYSVICYQEDTLISMANGNEKPIKELCKGDLVHCVDLDTYKVEIKECCGVEQTTFGTALCVLLENGYSVTVTPDHEILTFNGMKEARLLDCEADLIACPIITPTEGNCFDIAPWLGSDCNVAYLLGQLTGDGGLSRGCCICCGAEDNADRLIGWLEKKLPLLNANKYQHGSSWNVGISCSKFVNSQKMLEDLDMKHNCYNKSIPDAIMQHQFLNVKCSYLAGLFDSGGRITRGSNGNVICHYTSESPNLIQRLRKLLQCLGLSHQVRHNRIHIWDTAGLFSCINSFLVLKKFNGTISHGKHNSWVPFEEINKKFKNSGLSQVRFSKQTGLMVSTFCKQKKFSLLHSAELSGLEYGDLRFYKIRSIEELKNQTFYGMSVDKHHNLIANGIVAKNCYQEQVMQAFMSLSGLTASDGYAFIKGCAKKKPEIIAGFKVKFFKGCQNNGISVSVTKSIWKDLEKFAGYSFNLSHAASYAYMAYKSAYLKVHYPTEFICARLSVESIRRNFKDIEKYEKDAVNNFGFTLLPRDINLSKVKWLIVGERRLRKPLLQKGVGVKAAEDIVENQPYKGKDLLYDFAMRTGPAVTAKVVEAMKNNDMWVNIDDVKGKFDQIRKDKKKMKGRPQNDIFG